MAKKMKKFFVSYQYTAKTGGVTYKGFGNCFVENQEAPGDEEGLVNMNRQIREHLKQVEGAEVSVPVILFFREVS